MIYFLNTKIFHDKKKIITYPVLNDPLQYYLTNSRVLLWKLFKTHFFFFRFYYYWQRCKSFELVFFSLSHSIIILILLIDYILKCYFLLWIKGNYYGFNVCLIRSSIIKNNWSYNRIYFVLNLLFNTNWTFLFSFSRSCFKYSTFAQCQMHISRALMFNWKHTDTKIRQREWKKNTTTTKKKTIIKQHARTVIFDLPLVCSRSKVKRKSQINCKKL